MAPPPRYLITRNLIRRYFDRMIPDTKNIKKDDTALRASLLRYGIGHPKVKEAYDDMMFKFKKQEKMAKKFERNNPKTAVLRSLNFPTYQNLRRGKEKTWAVRPLNIYDGIIR